MAVERRFRSASVQATEALGEALGRLLGGGDVVALEGELGTGKTALVRGLARGLGVTDPVHSPTFGLLHEYTGPLTLYHFDAWMAGREAGFLESGGASLLGGAGVCAVEWADRIPAWLPAERLTVLLAHVSPAARDLRLRAPDGSPRLQAVLRELAPVAEGLREIPPPGEPDSGRIVPRDA